LGRTISTASAGRDFDLGWGRRPGGGFDRDFPHTSPPVMRVVSETNTGLGRGDLRRVGKHRERPAPRRSGGSIHWLGPTVGGPGALTAGVVSDSVDMQSRGRGGNRLDGGGTCFRHRRGRGPRLALVGGDVRARGQDLETGTGPQRTAQGPSGRAWGPTEGKTELPVVDSSLDVGRGRWRPFAGHQAFGCFLLPAGDGKPNSSGRFSEFRGRNQTGAPFIVSKRGSQNAKKTGGLFGGARPDGRTAGFELLPTTFRRNWDRGHHGPRVRDVFRAAFKGAKTRQGAGCDLLRPAKNGRGAPRATGGADGVKPRGG